MPFEGGSLKNLKDWAGGGLNLNLDFLGISVPNISPILIIILITVCIFFYFVWKYWDMTPWTRRDVYG